MNVNVSLNQISGERFMELDKPLGNIQVATNISVLKVTPYENYLDFGFVFTINYNPALAAITIKGSAKVMGEKKEMDDLKKSYDEKKALPPAIMQTISNVGFIESVLISKSLNIPPPIPLPAIAQQQQAKDSKPNLGYIA